MSIFHFFRKRKKYNTAPAPEPLPEEGQLLMEASLLSGHDSAWTTASFRNGTVYTQNALMGEFAIGRFSWNKNMFLVSCEYDGGEIGLVRPAPDGHGCQVFLSRMGVHRRLSRFAHANGGEQKLPEPPTRLAAISRDGALWDADSGEKLASFQGDDAGAAAAFICLSYEVHTKTPYSEFFKMSNW